MKSTIKIGRDENDSPVIFLNQSKDTDDLRDETIRKFLDKLHFTSCFCTIECSMSNETHNIWLIKPIGGLIELKELQTRVNDTVRLLENNIVTTQA